MTACLSATLDTSYDRPVCHPATPALANVMRNSGAAAALLPYRNHRLGLSGDGGVEDGTPVDPGGGGALWAL